ncbi:MAG: HNH endonuclease [Candidatus Competibacter sp.]|nr:HNH endonuclease [Candidatus Competibacter sp.]
MKSISKYTKALHNLRLDRARGKIYGGPAPHKPVLLLSIIDMIDTGQITSRTIEITPELVLSFKTHWSLLVDTEYVMNLALPFYHLHNEPAGFWHLTANPGYEKSLELGRKSFNFLVQVIQHAEIDQDFYGLLSDKNTRNFFRNLLLETYFPDKVASYTKSKGSNQDDIDAIERKITESSSIQYVSEYENLGDEERFIRSGFFKKIVPSIYKFTCCISGWRTDVLADIQLIDACHIIPFNTSHDDTIGNGICLCPNLHRAFDRGLLSIDQNLCVVISNRFTETENHPYSIKQFHGKRIHLPENLLFFPNQANLEWHRKNILKS